MDNVWTGSRCIQLRDSHERWFGGLVPALLLGWCLRCRYRPPRHVLPALVVVRLGGGSGAAGACGESAWAGDGAPRPRPPRRWPDGSRATGGSLRRERVGAGRALGRLWVRFSVRAQAAVELVTVSLGWLALL